MDSAFCVAVHALVYLNHKARLVPSEELAENICTNPARVRKVMAPLKKAGVVETREGSEGGYRFPGQPAVLTLDRVADILGVRFVDAAWHSGSQEMDCLISTGMAGLMDGLFVELDRLCRERLARISIADLDGMIFHTAAIERS